MPKQTPNKIIDEKKILTYIVRELKRKMFMNDVSSKEVAHKLWMTQPYLSSILWTRLSWNEDLYRKVAHSIGISDREFEEIKQQAIQEHFGIHSWDQNLDYALSSDLGNNADAVKEVQGFMEFVKQKYWIKK